MRTMLLAAVLLAGCATSTTKRLGLPPLTTVDHVELSRYLGTWYEIASFPQRFQKGCTATTANYTLRDDGLIRVLNRCRKDALDGPEDEAQGLARVVDPVTKQLGGNPRIVLLEPLDYVSFVDLMRRRKRRVSPGQGARSCAG